jgi:hypothetical protein
MEHWRRRIDQPFITTVSVPAPQPYQLLVGTDGRYQGADGSDVAVGGVVVVVDDGQTILSNGVRGAWMVDNQHNVIERVRTGRYGIVESLGVVDHDEFNQPGRFPGALGVVAARAHARHFADVALLNDEGDVTGRGRLYLHNVIAPHPLSDVLMIARRRFVKKNPGSGPRLFDFKVDGRSLYEFNQSELEELVVALDWHMGRQNPKTP